MIEEITVGDDSSKASHWASKSCRMASPAEGGTGGPQPSRNVRMRGSASGSLCGAGLGIHKFTGRGPELADLNSATQSPIPTGEVISAPKAPMPPAFATAIDRLAG